MSETATVEPAALPAPVIDGAAYTLRQLAHAAGICSKTLRIWQEKGLKVRRIGQRKYVLGSDFLQFLSDQQPG